MNALFPNDFRLVHFFHRVNFLSFFEFHTPDFAEASFSDNILAIKMISIDFLALQNEPAFLLFFGVELGEIDLEAVLYVFGGLFRNGRVTSVMFFLSPGSDFFAFSSLFGPVVSSRHHCSYIAVDAHLPRLSSKLPGVLRRELLTLGGHSDGVNLWFAASLRVEQKRFGGDSHRDWTVDLLEEVVHDCSRGLARFFSAGIFAMDFFAIRLTFHM
jgi:hypothetical protein